MTRLQRGDDTVTAEDLLRARAEVERYSLLLPAAEKALTRAERGLLSDDTSLADLVVPTVSTVVGMNAVAVNQFPDNVEAPFLAVVQTRHTKRDALTGYMSGSVEVVLTRSQMHRCLERDLMVKALEDKAWKVAASQVESVETGRVHVDRLTITIERGIEALPVIEHDAPSFVISGVRYLPVGRLQQRLTNPRAGSAEVRGSRCCRP